VLRTPSWLVVVVLAFAVAGCGGGGGDSEPEHAGVAAFPDVLEIARAELGETAPLHDVTVSEKEISFVNVQFGRNVRVKYNTDAVFVGGEPVRERLNPALTFSIAEVPNDAPARLLAAIQEREDGDVAGFTASLRRDRRQQLKWRAKTRIDGEARQYVADLSGALRP
jgi:hypothetical protein